MFSSLREFKIDDNLFLDSLSGIFMLLQTSSQNPNPNQEYKTSQEIEHSDRRNKKLNRCGEARKKRPVYMLSKVVLTPQ